MNTRIEGEAGQKTAENRENSESYLRKLPAARIPV
jgi:hypothetical protein